MKHLYRIATIGLVGAVLLTGMGLASANAISSTLYVDNGNPACSDSNTGADLAHPFCTINKGATVAVAGQTVRVSSGTYNEEVSVNHSGSAGSPIVFTVAPAATVTVTGGSPNFRGFSVWKKSYITINGFDITGTTQYGIYVSSSGAPGSTHNITITNNHVSSSGQPVQFQTYAGIYLQDTDDSLVSGNTTNANTDNGIAVIGTSTGVTVRNNESYNNASGWTRNANGIEVLAPGNTIIDNKVHDNEDSGIQVYPGGDNTLVANNLAYNNGDHGLDNRGVSGGRVIGNTVYHNCTSGINVEGTSANYTVENNISVDNAVYPAYNGISCSRGVGNIRVWDSATSSTNADYNIVDLSTSGFEYGWGVSYSTLAAMKSAHPGQETHGIENDPQFVDAASADFRVSAGSPAIDSADSAVSGEQSHDFAGSGRVNDPSTTDTGVGPRTYDDRGAYEFDAAPTAALTLSPSSGAAPVNVTANASGSTDTDLTGIASYTFNFGDGSADVGPQAGATANHAFTHPGVYQVQVTVKDSANKSSTASATMTVGSTNLVKNPGFESSLSGWTAAPTGTGCTIGRAKVGHTGSWSAYVQNTSLRKQSCALDDYPNWVGKTAAGVYTAQIWVRGAKAGATFMLSLREYYGRTFYGNAYKRITLTTSWQLVTIRYGVRRVGSTLNFYTSAYQGKGLCYYADDASIFQS